MVAVYLSSQFRAEQKSSRHFPVDGVDFFRGWDESVFQQCRHEFVHLQSSTLLAEVKYRIFSEGLSQNQGSLCVSINEILNRKIMKVILTILLIKLI